MARTTARGKRQNQREAAAKASRHGSLEQILGTGDDEPAPAAEAPAAEAPAAEAPAAEAPAPKVAPEDEGVVQAAVAEAEAATETAAAEAPAEAKATEQPAEVPAEKGSARKAAAKAHPRNKLAKTEETQRVGLYLHPDDYRALGLAKLEDKVDFNARIRAMITLYLDNGKVREQVDRIAREQPRGPYRRTD